MNYEAFALEYEQTQVVRIQKSLENIRTRGAEPGREVPDNEDLVIGAGRRIPIAVMFLDICGFSSRLNETAQEQDLILKALNLFFTEMVRIAEDYGATVEKNTGDGLMAYFEDGGIVHSASGSKRAVACGLTMFRTVTRLVNPALVASSVSPITFRLAIDHGYVTIARLGAARRFNAIVAVGTAANVASKMLRLGGPGEMIIGDTVRNSIPFSWHQFTTLIPENSGWIYRATGLQYPFYRYTGRWTQ